MIPHWWSTNDAFNRNVYSWHPWFEWWLGTGNAPNLYNKLILWRISHEFPAQRPVTWVNNREAGDARRYRAHYDVIVMARRHVLTSPPNKPKPMLTHIMTHIFVTRPKELMVGFYQSTPWRLDRFSTGFLQRQAGVYTVKGCCTKLSFLHHCFE